MDKVSWAVVVVAIRLLELLLKFGTVQLVLFRHARSMLNGQADTLSDVASGPRLECVSQADGSRCYRVALHFLDRLQVHSRPPLDRYAVPVAARRGLRATPRSLEWSRLRIECLVLSQSQMESDFLEGKQHPCFLVTKP